MNVRTRRWTGPLLLFLITAGFFWRLVLSNQFTWLDSPDFAYQVVPWFQFQAGAWHEWQLPLWDPYEWGGQPLVGQAQPGAAYPLNWLLFALRLKNGWIRQVWLHWYYVAFVFMGALFCFWLCRDLKRSYGASLLAAVGFALGGWLARIGWPQMANGALWAPLMLLFFLRTMRGESPWRNAAFAGASLGMAYLSGHHQVPIFVTVVAAGLWLYHFFTAPRRWPAAGHAAVFGVFLALVSAMQTLPAYEYGKLAVRWVGAKDPVGWDQPVPYYVHSTYSFSPPWMLGTILPGVFDHTDPFIGVVLLTLALLAVALAWSEPEVKIFTAIALAGLVLALGEHSVFHGVLYALAPMVEKARSPSQALFIFHLGIAVLSAYAADYFADQKWTKRAAKCLVVFGALAFLLYLVPWMVQYPRDFSAFAMAGLTALLLALVLQGRRRGQISSKVSISLLILLILLEVGNVNGRWYPRQLIDNSMLAKLSQDGELVQFLRARPGPVRVELDDQQIPYNFGDFYGIDVFGGYLASLTTNIEKIHSDFHTHMLFGINYWLGKKPLRDDQIELYSASNGMKVYQNPQAFPRTWVVHEVGRLDGLDKAAGALQSPLAELRRKAFVVGTPPRLERCADIDEARLVRRYVNAVEIEADLGCRGMVVLGETYFPGWHALIDGRSAPVYAAYGALRGVVVEKGRHHIELRYRPLSVYAGIALTFTGWFAVLGLWITGRRHRQRKLRAEKSQPEI